MIGLTNWARQRHIPTTVRLHPAAENQLCFVRDQLGPLLGARPESTADGEYGDWGFRVASTHVSKSIELPVYFLETSHWKLYLRGNFYDWKFSVIPTDAHFTEDLDTKDLLSPSPIGTKVRDDRIPAVYCEGFNPSWICERYHFRSWTKGAFTEECGNEYQLYAFLWQLKHQTRLWLDGRRD